MCILERLYVTLTTCETQVIWRSTDVGTKTVDIPGSDSTNKGKDLYITTTIGDGSLYIVTPESGTIDGGSSYSFIDDRCTLSLRSDGDNEDWIIRCLCCRGETCMPYFIYSNRLVNPNYSGNLYMIRRASDNVTMSFAPDSNGNAPSSAISTFIGASTGRIKVWYDQSGNGLDVSEDIPNWGDGPTWLNSQVNGHPSLLFFNSIGNIARTHTCYGTG